MGSQKQKWLAAFLIAVLAITATTGAVYAYLSATTDPVENTFSPASDPDISIAETFPTGTNPTKQNVRVEVGDPGYAVYVRVAIVPTWQKTVDGKTVTHWRMPVGAETAAVGIDYIMDWNQTDWFYNENDGYYYLRAMVNSNNTPVLINECYQISAAPEAGYTLHIEIIAQTIQAKGSADELDKDGNPIPAVTDAWGVKVGDDGKLVAPTT